MDITDLVKKTIVVCITILLFFFFASCTMGFFTAAVLS